jgi:chromosome segregation ATPase
MIMCAYVRESILTCGSHAQVIEELDEKKNQALKTTYAKVSRDFTSIFTTLLPNAKAKLEPPEVHLQSFV